MYQHVYSKTTQRKLTIEGQFRTLMDDNKREAEILLIKLQQILRGPERKRNVG